MEQRQLICEGCVRLADVAAENERLRDENGRSNTAIAILVGGLSGTLIVVNHMVATANDPKIETAMENWRDNILKSLSDSNAARQQREEGK